jgi:hypothetical protein
MRDRLILGKNRRKLTLSAEIPKKHPPIHKSEEKTNGEMSVLQTADHFGEN